MQANTDSNTPNEEELEALQAEEIPSAESLEDIANIIQALVFASPEVITIRKLREIIGEPIDPQSVKECLMIANDKLNSIQSPFEIVEQAGGFRFRTRTRYYYWVRKLFPDLSARRLSQAALETLAIIAYKQPITKAEIERVRGVGCDGPLRSLLEKKMIALSGRSDAPGNPYYYSTTDEFLKYFGINRIQDDLPRLEEFEDIIQAGELIPQLSRTSVHEPAADVYDPDQIELPMGDE
jgi:segregation and condensation protein B